LTAPIVQAEKPSGVFLCLFSKDGGKPEKRHRAKASKRNSRSGKTKKRHKAKASKRNSTKAGLPYAD
jgi:hypothetical protein